MSQQACRRARRLLALASGVFQFAPKSNQGRLIIVPPVYHGLIPL
jgi:hypothetical protein